MKIQNICKNNKGQVLGLPMYLIIVMIVAVAVIAAVIYMIPQGTRTMKASVTENAVAPTATGTYTISSSSPPDVGTITWNAFETEVIVTTQDDEADPIAGATVLIYGNGVTEQVTTDQDGKADFSGSDTLDSAYLPPNVNEGYLKIKISASGFEDLELEQGILLYRP